MASASERRAQRELAEARASGNAPPEVDVKTGAMINPHNPEFITKKPWYLAEGGSGGGGEVGDLVDETEVRGGVVPVLVTSWPR